MIDRDQLARMGQRAALTVRRNGGIGPTDPICVFDLAERLNIEVRFRPEKSLTGMYSKSSGGVILVSAHRPPGQRAFTCAHEMGHHVFGHGTRVDEYVTGGGRAWQNFPEEWLADQFAASLLMPKAAVLHAFKVRAWVPAACTATQAYRIAGQLGVGYTTLLVQMSRSLGIISGPRTEELQAVTPREIRKKILGTEAPRHLVVADEWWNSKVAVDLEVGDHVVLPAGTLIEGSSLVPIGDCDLGLVAAAEGPGRSRVELPQRNWAAFVRVSKHLYIGRNMFRFLEVPDGDNLP